MADQTSSLTDFDSPQPELPTALAVLGGAALGGLAGFLFLTTAGNRVRRDVLAAAEGLFDGLDTLLTTWNRVQDRSGQPGRSAARPLHRPHLASDDK